MSFKDDDKLDIKRNLTLKVQEKNKFNEHIIYDLQKESWSWT